MSLAENVLPAPVMRGRTSAYRVDERSPGSVPTAFGKILFDFSVALVLLILAFPVLLLVAVLVKLTSSGPFLYRQIRSGKGGRPFTICKVRTMVQDSERNGACWSLPGDPRITWFGRFLRWTHLDELPQLWNVLCGDMSLIGPRPERPEFIPGLETAIPRYRERLLVRPGLTGLAQVQLPSDTEIESVRRKIAYDLWYVQNRTFGLDVRILIATALKMCGARFGFLRWLLRFPTREVVERSYAMPAGLRKESVAEKPEETLHGISPQFVPVLLNVPEQA